MHTPFDLALVALYCVIWVAVEMWRLPHTRARMAGAPLGARAGEYFTILATEWALVVALLGRLLWTGTPVAAVGLRLPQGFLAWAASVAAIALTLWLLALQQRATRSERGRAAIARQLGHLGWFLPRERREFAAFGMLSITAGVCEEVLFRGHLMAFLDPLIGPLLATVVAVALFGIAHAYQGPRGIVSTAMVGLVMALVYRATGSLLAPIVMHALIDFCGGRMIESVVSAGLRIGGAPGGEAVAGDANQAPGPA